MNSPSKTNPGPAYLLSEVGAAQEAERLRRQGESLLDQELPLLLETLPARARVVDLGCGMGLLADALSRARPDLRVLGADADAFAVAEARRLFGGRSGLDFVQASLQAGPPAGMEAADAVVLRLVLMHQADSLAALRACAAWLKPGGRLHVLEGDDRELYLRPSADWQPRLVHLMQAVQRHRGGNRHLGRELCGLLTQAGFRVEFEQRLDFSLQRLGPVFAAVFEPVAAFYLRQAVELGLCSASEAETLNRHVHDGCAGGFQEARVPLFYVRSLKDAV
jgi:SAM-dependent methyltransferase